MLTINAMFESNGSEQKQQIERKTLVADLAFQISSFSGQPMVCRAQRGRIKMKNMCVYPNSHA